MYHQRSRQSLQESLSTNEGGQSNLQMNRLNNQHSYRNQFSASDNESVNPHNQSSTTIPHNTRCEEHDELATNFCASVGCLLALCPDCIDSHYRQHQIDQTQSQVDSIKRTKHKCIAKINAAAQQLQKEVDDCEKYHPYLNQENDMNQIMGKFYQLKDSLFEMIKIQIDNVEVDLKNKLHQSMAQRDHFMTQISEVNLITRELDDLKFQLESPSHVIEAIQKTCQLDLVTLKNEFKSNINKAAQQVGENQVDLIIEESEVSLIEQSFKRVIQVVNKQQITKKKQNQSRSHSSSTFSLQTQVVDKSSSPSKIPSNLLSSLKKSTPQLITSSNEKIIQQLRQESHFSNKNLAQKSFSTLDQINTNSQLSRNNQDQYDQANEGQTRYHHPLIQQENDIEDKLSLLSEFMTKNSTIQLEQHVEKQVLPQLDQIQIAINDHFEYGALNKFIHNLQLVEESGKNQKERGNYSILSIWDLQSQQHSRILQMSQNNTLSSYTLTSSIQLTQMQLKGSYKSLTLFDGDLLLVSHPKNNNILSSESGEIFKFDLSGELKKINKDNMRYPRNQFSICLLRHYLCVIGGAELVEGEQSRLVNSRICERFNMRSCKWEEMSDLNEAVRDTSLCQFNNRFLFRFGGVLDNGKLSQNIEKYDMSLNVWRIVKWESQQQISNKQLSYLSGCLQINQSQILICGGFQEYQQSTNALQIFTVGQKKDPTSLLENNSKEENFSYSLQQFPSLSLPSQCYFKQPPILFNNYLHLMGCNSSTNTNEMFLFNGRNWTCIPCV